MRDTRSTRLLLAAALATALALIALSYAGGSSPLIRSIAGVADSAFGAAERAVSPATLPVDRFLRSGTEADVGQVTALQRQLMALRAELAASRLSSAQYSQLHQLLAVSGTARYHVLAASVIAFGQGYQQTVTVDAGSAAGVRPEQTVLGPGGLVGRVIAVSGQTCTVLLASDASSVVGVRLEPGGQIGWVTGNGRTGAGTGLLSLQILDPAAVLKPGAQLVTAASVRDRPFVPGVPVGVISAVRNRAGALTAQALVRPYADFTALEVVGIVIATTRYGHGPAVLPSRRRAGH